MVTTLAVERLITTGEAAKILGLTITTVRRYGEEGRIRAINTPLGLLLDGDDVRLFAEERTRRKGRKEVIGTITQDDV